MKKITQLLCLILLSSLLLLPRYAARAEPPGIALYMERVDTTSFPSVNFRLSAWDASGLPLSDLKPEDFCLQEDEGAPFHPTSLEVDNQAALQVVLVIDVSGSMAGQPLVDAKSAAARFIDRLGAKDKVAVVAFSSPVNLDPQVLNPKREIALTADREDVYNLIEGLQSNGEKTQLYDAAAKALQVLSSQPVGHRAMLLLSDGRNDPAEAGDPHQAIRLAQEARLPIFVIGLGSQIDESYLRRLASESGGMFRAAPRSSELARLFGDMASLLKTQYRLSYTTKLPADGKVHSLKIILDQAGGTATSKIKTDPFPHKLAVVETEPGIPQLTIPQGEETATPVVIVQMVTGIPTVQAENNLPPDQEPQKADIPLWVWAAGILFLLVVIFLLIRRRKSPKPEACAKCGYDLTGKSGDCPQCGNTKRLPKL